MTHKRLVLSPAVERAVRELKQVVGRQYPTAAFSVQRGADDPSAIHLVTTVDVADTDEVLDVVMDRVLELQIEQGYRCTSSPCVHSNAIWTSFGQGPLALTRVDGWR